MHAKMLPRGLQAKTGQRLPQGKGNRIQSNAPAGAEYSSLPIPWTTRLIQIGNKKPQDAANPQTGNR